MQIRALLTFLDGTSRYEEGVAYEVEEPQALRFIANGWAEGPHGVTGDGCPAHTALDIQSAIHHTLKE
jgi:hypothetical protein